MIEPEKLAASETPLTSPTVAGGVPTGDSPSVENVGARTASEASSSASGPELIIGLVGPIGVDLYAVTDALKASLADVGYDAQPIHLMDSLKELALKERPQLRESDPPEIRYRTRMDEGNWFRKNLEKAEAFAFLGIHAIRKKRLRVSKHEERAIPRCAYILHSLKTPDEIALLRRVYGDNCLILAAHAPRTTRIENLAGKTARRYAGNASAYTGAAHDLVARDEREAGDKFGQNMRGTFHLADAFIDARSGRTIQDSVARLIKILFNHPLETPYRAEFAMFEAFGCALRSSHSDRQIGAAITNPEGEVVALGANEVASPRTGLYWAEDGGERPDSRDLMLPHDSNQQTIQSILQDLIYRLRQRKLLVGENFDKLVEQVREAIRPLSADELSQDVPEPVSAAARERALLLNLIEFIRTVHAEMAALMFAARRGIAVKDGTMYATTFPCHECARHIVAAGIEKVIYLEPYPKSRTEQLYDDSIDVDGNGQDGRVSFRPFVGVAPRRYMQFFSLPKRKNDDGTWYNWQLERRTQLPRAASPAVLYLARETEMEYLFDQTLRAKQLLK